jgi:SpoVK/Ycf46/Vps4 family AAA+-type ATPase
LSTHVVSPTASFFSGATPTIGAALKHARDGDTIQIAPGFYQEELTITKSVALIGAGRAKVTISGSIAISGGTCRLTGLSVQDSRGSGVTISGHGVRAHLDDLLVHAAAQYGVWATRHAIVEIADIEMFATEGIAIDAGAEATIRKCRVHDAEGNGLDLRSGGKASVEDGEFFGFAKPAIAVADPGSECRLSRTQIKNCASNGIHLCRNARATIDSVAVTNAAHPAIAIDTGAEAIILDAKIHETESDGVTVRSGGKATIERGEFFGFASPAIAIGDRGSECCVSGTRIGNCASNGIRVFQNARATIDGVDITKTSHPAIAVDTGAEAVIRDAKIHDTEGNCVNVRSGGKATLERGEFFGCANPAVAVGDLGSECHVSGTRISNCAGDGILVVQKARATIDGVAITNAAHPAIAIDTGAEAVIRDAKIHDTQSNGITLRGGGKAIVERGEFFGCADPAIAVGDPGSECLLSDALIQNCASNGIHVSRNARATIDSVDITKASLPAIAVETGADVVTRNTKVHDCAGAAFACRGASPRIEGGEIWACADPPILCDPDDAPVIIDLMVRDARGVATRIGRNQAGKPIARPAAKAPTASAAAPLKPPVTIPQPSIASPAMARLDTMIGLDEVKREIAKLVNLVTVQARRRERGLPVQPVSLHMVFTGNPGSGKTSVAKLMGELLASLGLLAKGHVVTAERHDLVAGYVGQTAARTQEKIDAAEGGILFIDEAYTLAPADETSSDFGSEAIDTLLAAMEAGHERFAVIIAGNPSRMQQFIDANPGLRSRFTRYIHFPDYRPNELTQMFLQLCRQNGCVLGDGTAARIEAEISYLHAHRGPDFANARVIRTLFDATIEQQAARVADDMSADLALLLPADIPSSHRPSSDDLPAALAELDRLIGLDAVKAEIHMLVDLVKAQTRRQAKGLPVSAVSLHMVFSGSPGTGKTSVARLVGRIFSSLGLLERGHVVEVQRADLVAGYVGQTALRVQQKVKEALGGILFIDEAYALAGRDGAPQDFGHEAIETLLKEMEDRRGAFAVIAAGYTEEMAVFLAANPGLPSRFSRVIEFADYGLDELTRIFQLLCEQDRYQIDDKTLATARALLQHMHDDRDASFGNARAVRDVFERAVERQAVRLGSDPDADPAWLVAEDLPESVA